MYDHKYDWDDVSLVPSKISSISSRSEIEILNSDKKLPLWVSPMDTVISDDNYKLYLDKGYNVCLVRGMDYKNIDFTKCFVSLGLDEVIEKYNNGDLPPKLLIDVAHGGMQKLLDISKKIKVDYPNIELMIGNIANPETYNLYSEIGVNYIRCGIGAGAGCTTSANGAIHYPMASLIKEVYMESLRHNTPATIIADGGFKNYSDIIKGLAFGSEVMLGSVLNKTIESAGPCYYYGVKIPQNIATKMYSKGFKVTKKFRGMSTKEVQKKWGKTNLTTSEGVIRYRDVEYTLDGWTNNFKDYLKSAMSYCNCRTIEEFVGNVDYNLITENSFKRYNK
jgi:IMP dehydrogenase/GMP reductase